MGRSDRVTKTKEKKQPEPRTYICNESGREISGDHVYIRTRRRTELHIHFECMPGRRSKDPEVRRCKENTSTTDIQK